MTPVMLAMTLFCCVSGGPFGLEPLIGETGGGFALMLILLTPIFWALPDSLTTAELAPAIPEEGGYIVWVKRAMGPFAGVVNAWWSWMYSLLDATIYPVLFATYLWQLLVEHFGVQIAGRELFYARWGTALLVIVFFTLLNIRGVRQVGRSSTIFTILIVAPFALFVIIGLVKMGMQPRPVIHEFLLPDKTPLQALSGGLAIVLWNYLGWDALSTIAEEVEEPQRAYPRAIAFGLVLITAVYALPTVVGLAFFPDATQWEEGVWPTIARAVGGDWLMWLMHVAALVSPIALFTASLLASSRIPFVMAEDGCLPKKLAAIHPKFGTPWVAVLVCGIVYSLFSSQSFEDLVEMNVIMYCAALTLESISLIVLRYKEPNLPRPFKIPGGIPALIVICGLPISLGGLLLYAMVMDAIGNPDKSLVRTQIIIVSALLVSGPIVYLLTRKRSSLSGDL